MKIKNNVVRDEFVHKSSTLSIPHSSSCSRWDKFLDGTQSTSCSLYRYAGLPTKYFLRYLTIAMLIFFFNDKIPEWKWSEHTYCTPWYLLKFCPITAIQAEILLSTNWTSHERPDTFFLGNEKKDNEPFLELLSDFPQTQQTRLVMLF